MDLEVTPDTPLHWLLCGDETHGCFVGPHVTVEDAEEDRVRSACDHDHVTFTMTPMQLARSLARVETALWSGHIWRVIDHRMEIAVAGALWPLRSFDLARTVLPMVHELKEALCAV